MQLERLIVMNSIRNISVKNDGREGDRIHSPSIRRVWAKYILAVSLYALVFGFWQAESAPMQVHLLGVLIIAIGLLPITCWYAKGSHWLPMFELICLAYVIQFGIPICLQLNQTEVRGGRIVLLAWDQTYRAVLLTVLGLGSLITLYYVALSSKLMRKMPKFDLAISPRSRIVYYLINLAIGLSWILLRVLDLVPSLNSRLGAFVSLASSQSYIAITLLAYEVYQGRQDSMKTKLILYCSLATSVMLGLTTGGLENAFVPIAAFLVVRWHCTQKIPWKTLMLGGVLFVFILQPVKSAYRSQIWFANTTPGLTERMNLWLKLSQDGVENLVRGDILTDGEKMFRQSMMRLDLLHQFVLVQEMTPSTIPYYQGETYRYLAYSWIPRLLWPEKPIAQQANITFALDYGLLYDDQIDKTMTGVSHLAEAYANFGIWGIVIVMGFQGIILAAINIILNSAGSEGGRAVYISIMVFFLNGIGSATAGMFGGIIQNILLSALVLKLLDVGLRARQEFHGVSTRFALPHKRTSSL